jgi:hypothetical protein
VRIGRECTGQAEGRTKKIAAQRAARGVYERLLERGPVGAAAAEAEASELPPAEPPEAVTGQ